MKLTPAQRQQLEKDLGALQRAQDAVVSSATGAVVRAYGEALRRALVAVGRLVRGVPRDAAGRLVPTLAAAASVSPTLAAANEPFRLVWREWAGQLSELMGLQADYAARVGNTNALWLGQERSALEALVGLWGEGAAPERGLALRFYTFTTGERARLANGITQHILGALPGRQLDRYIEDALDAAPARASQLVQDGTMELVRGAHDIKARSLGLSWFRYSGPDDAVARPFCKARVGFVYSRDQIERMDNGQTGGAGALIACGGFRCRHRWAPVDEDWYSPEEWARLTSGPQTQTEEG